MQLFEAAVLGILQGTAEWLPISSEGQTMLAMMNWLGLSPETALSCSIFLHLGTMTAALIRFRRRFLDALRNMSSRTAQTLIVATFCTGITGLPLYFLFRESFTGGREATLLIGVLLIATGILLRFKGTGSHGVEDLGLRDMVLLGLAQGLAILPGVSRSGTTVTFLLMRNLRQQEALTLSFMISVPAVMASVAIDGFPANVSMTSGAVMLGFSFIAGYLTMDLLMRFAGSVDFSKFCVALGLVTLGLGFL